MPPGQTRMSNKVRPHFISGKDNHIRNHAPPRTRLQLLTKLNSFLTLQCKGPGGVCFFRRFLTAPPATTLVVCNCCCTFLGSFHRLHLRRVTSWSRDIMHPNMALYLKRVEHTVCLLQWTLRAAHGPMSHVWVSWDGVKLRTELFIVGDELFIYEVNS